MLELQCGMKNYVFVIDTGSPKIWDTSSHFKTWVNAAGYAKIVDRKLITTHFHADHHDSMRAGGVKWDEWIHGQGMKNTPKDGTLVPGGGKRLLEGTEGDWTFRLDAYAPDWSTIGDDPSDENDLSLAIAFYVSNGLDGLSFLSFGDMTKDGEARLGLGHLFCSTVAKYPHHGSNNNFLNYFGLGCNKMILISGDSGSAVETVVNLLNANAEVAVRVLCGTREAWQQFGRSWETRCRLYPDCLNTDVQVGDRLVIEWTSGFGFSGASTQVTLVNSKKLAKVPTRRGSTTSWVDA